MSADIDDLMSSHKTPVVVAEGSAESTSRKATSATLWTKLGQVEVLLTSVRVRHVTVTALQGVGVCAHACARVWNVTVRACVHGHTPLVDRCASGFGRRVSQRVLPVSPCTVSTHSVQHGVDCVESSVDPSATDEPSPRGNPCSGAWYARPCARRCRSSHQWSNAQRVLCCSTDEAVLAPAWHGRWEHKRSE